MSPAQPLKIAIIGAGPVSLTLASILRNQNIPFTVYEAADSFRTQGGSLDLHPESGQLALREAGLWDAFVKHSRPEGDCDKIVELSGEVLWDENLLKKPVVADEDKFSGRPEIDRRALMNILFENLNSSAISFGKKLDRVVPSATEPDKHDLYFSNGQTDTGFDIVIGADGAWSRVRNLLTDAKPHYSGISMVEVNCHDVASNKWLNEYIGAGSMFSFGEGRAIFAQKQGDGSLRTYAALRVPQDFIDTCDIEWKSKDRARKEVVERYFNDIGDDLKRVILECGDDLTPRALFELPVDFEWQHRAGVTLIGDAAHVMTPFAGVGVNVGMTDALVLAREIVAAVKGQKDVGEAIREYERGMWPRAEKYARKTKWGKENSFSEEGSRVFADMMRSHHVAV